MVPSTAKQTEPENDITSVAVHTTEVHITTNSYGLWGNKDLWELRTALELQSNIGVVETLIHRLKICKVFAVPLEPVNQTLQQSHLLLLLDIVHSMTRL